MKIAFNQYFDPRVKYAYRIQHLGCLATRGTPKLSCFVTSPRLGEPRITGKFTDGVTNEDTSLC